MCNPAVAVGATGAMQLGGALAGYAGQSAQADAQNRFQTDRYYATARAAEANYNRAVSQTARQQNELRSVAGQEALQTSISNLQAQGSAQAALASTGNAGVSADLLFRDFERQQAMSRQNTRDNLTGELQGSFDRLEEFRASNQSRINSALPQPVSSPSMLAALFQAGSAGANAYTDYLRLT